jgi:hypothetical protein
MPPKTTPDGGSAYLWFRNSWPGTAWHLALLYRAGPEGEADLVAAQAFGIRGERSGLFSRQEESRVWSTLLPTVY